MRGGGTCPRQLYGAGAYVIISMTICNNNFTIAISTGRGATGSIHPRNLSCEGSAYDAWPLTVCPVNLCPVCNFHSFIHSFIHSVHTALASGAVYCSRSCLCVYGGRAARRACGCPNFTAVQARSVCPSVSTFFIHSLIQLLLLNSPQTLIIPKHLKFKCNNSIRQRRNCRE